MFCVCVVSLCVLCPCVSCLYICCVCSCACVVSVCMCARVRRPPCEGASAHRHLRAPGAGRGAVFIEIDDYYSKSRIPICKRQPVSTHTESRLSFGEPPSSPLLPGPRWQEWGRKTQQVGHRFEVSFEGAGTRAAVRGLGPTFKGVHSPARALPRAPPPPKPTLPQ